MDGQVQAHERVRLFMALGWGRVVSGAPNAGFYVDDASMPAVKFQNL
jgi:hypothetical protein